MKCCGKEMIGVEYHWKSPNHYDGISEYRCLICGSRIGRWSDKELKNGEEERIFGKEDCPSCLKETSLSL